MQKKTNLYQKYFKRIFDLILSLIAIIVFSPILVIIVILVKVKLGSPVFFKQPRPGKSEKIFTMYKFRTMTDEKDLDGNLLPDDVRITKFGKILRSTSLDELPGLFNIINGSMSIVGPRPKLVRDMFFMSDEQRKRHTVLPGLTGYAQVNGRNNINWEERLELDLRYIENISFANDIRIILQTVVKVFKKEDISTEGMETSEDLGDYLLRSNRICEQIYFENIEKSEKLLEFNKESL